MTYRVKEFRESMGLSQVELSERSNVSRTTISGLENGNITVTSTSTLQKIANALGKSISDIFSD